MITDARPSTISDIPRAFCCSETGKLMRDPVLALCGHLFERSVVDGGGTLCPHDKNMVREYVSCAELKELIRERYPKTVTSSVLKHSVLRKFPNVIYRAHDDDIHGIIKLSSGKIVTG